MRSKPAQLGEDRFGLPTLERSGSEHRESAVTSPLTEEEGLGEKVEPSLAKEGRSDSKDSALRAVHLLSSGKRKAI